MPTNIHAIEPSAVEVAVAAGAVGTVVWVALLHISQSWSCSFHIIASSLLGAAMLELLVVLLAVKLEALISQIGYWSGNYIERMGFTIILKFQFFFKFN